MRIFFYFRIFFIFLVFYLIFTASFFNFSYALGIGECHTLTLLNNPIVSWFYPSGEVAWVNLEPEKGKYNFSSIDNLINIAKQHRKKILIYVAVSNPAYQNNYSFIPQWAINEGMRIANPGLPIQWDPIYLRYHEAILKEIAKRYEKPEYYDVIGGILMQSGGSWGEMTLPYKNCYGSPNADVLDPNNIFVKEMARVFLGSESKAYELTRVVDEKIIFDNYYIQAVKNIVDLYGSIFTHYPFLIQFGNGLSCRERVSQEVASYAVQKYKDRAWLKSNSWGSFTTIVRNEIDPIFNQFKNKTRISYEVGHPSYFCASENGKYPRGICWNCCYWRTKEEAIRHNNQAINIAINSGATSICFQTEMIVNQDKYPINMNELLVKLKNNTIPFNLTLTPSAPHQPLHTSEPNCICQNDGTCHSSCPVNIPDNYWKEAESKGVVYTNPMKCSLIHNNLYKTPPSQTEKNQFCNRILRPKGDINGDGRVDFLTDYLNYLRVLIGIKIDSKYNFDVNGDGYITSLDGIIIKNNISNF